jgi:hypothetical protein
VQHVRHRADSRVPGHESRAHLAAHRGLVSLLLGRDRWLVCAVVGLAGEAGSRVDEQFGEVGQGYYAELVPRAE